MFFGNNEMETKSASFRFRNGNKGVFEIQMFQIKDILNGCIF